MRIKASVSSSPSAHVVSVDTGSLAQSIAVPPKPAGQGSAVSGGEFLMLALATCYCNDLYREAARLGIAIDGVHVEASAEFPGVGLAATNISYHATVESSASSEEIKRLLLQTDSVAEVHNTIRAGVPVQLNCADVL
jgi:uncharacterized OsmC-like protein